MEWIFTLQNIGQVAREIVDYLAQKNKKVIALYGAMGAGKTTLSIALAQSLGSRDTASSPTFSIINEYEDATGSPIYHMDWYRLKDTEEALHAGVEEPLYSGNWCLVEWPEKAPDLLPPSAARLCITVVDEKTRQVTLQSPL